MTNTEASEATPTPTPTPRLSWTQPSCTDCWVDENGEFTDEGVLVSLRTPTTFRDPDASSFMDTLTQCCKCGRGTTSGIFIRVDPATVRYPRSKEDD